MSAGPLFEDGTTRDADEARRLRRSRASEPAEEPVAPLPLVPPAPPPPPPRPIEIRHRRRRAGALVLVAVSALLLGLIAGAGSSGSSPVQRYQKLSPVGYFGHVATLAGTGAGSLQVAEARAEQAAISRTLAYTPFVREAGSQHREVALTFDDGPGPYTPQVVRALARMHAPATFFEVGIEERYFSQATSEIVAHGWPIGDHTQTHAPMGQLPPKAQQRQLLEQTAAIGDSGAPFPRLFRPPYGLWDAATLALLKHYKMLMVLWTVDTSDYQMPGVDAIVQRTLDGAKPGAIILLHDAGGNRSDTVAALPPIIRGLRARGYRLVTVPRLLLDNPAPKDQDLTGLVGSGG